RIREQSFSISDHSACHAKAAASYSTFPSPLSSSSSFSFVIVQRATHVFPHRCGEDADVACELVELIQSDGHDLITLADGNGVLRRTKLQGVVSQRSRLHNSPVT
ncbi:hypothetical protein, partial [Pseudomonas aeruginosa]|uniref:hypothetical protein n=1 Tax=Pseudomonas aeruginosa TaxID=287 RepID=UPI001A9D6628